MKQPIYVTWIQEVCDGYKTLQGQKALSTPKFDEEKFLISIQNNTILS